MRPRCVLTLASLALSLPAVAAVPDATWLRQAARHVEDQRAAIRASAPGAWTSEAPSGLSPRWSAGELRLTTGSWSASWRLTGVGRGETAPAPAIVSETVSGARLEWHRASGLTEWHVSQECGLEFGFTLAERPAGEGALVLEGDVLSPGARLAVDGADAVLTARDGERVRISGLLVLDADGREIPARLAVRGRTLRIEVDDASAAYPLTIDPYVTSPAQRFEGNANGAFMGYSVANAGDVNGDGFGDVIVGAYTMTIGQGQEGAAFVFFGSAGGIDPAPDWRVESNQVGARLGSSVAGALDVNRDGYGDVLVAAPLWDSGGTDVGAVFVFHGGPAFGGAVAAVSADAILTGAAPLNGFGSVVANAGDPNDDNWDDVIVGAAMDDTFGTNAGAAYVFQGSAAGIVGTGPGTAWTTLPSPQAGSRFGTSAAGGGDVNGDGYQDVVVGAPMWDGGQSDEGAAFVYLGSASGLSTTPSWRAEGDILNSWLGQSVALSGSVNCDRFADVLVGTPQGTGKGTAHLKEGWVAVWHGSAATSPDAGLGPNGTPVNADWFGESNQSSSRFGWSVALLRDSRCSTCADVIVGAPWWDASSITNRGAVFVWEGSASGLGLNGQAHLLPASGGPDQTFAGPRASDEQGASVAGVLTVDGDRGDDLFFGLPGFDNGNFNEGAAQLHLSTCPDGNDPDGDGIPNCCDLFPADPNRCNDSDADGCDDCSGGFGDNPGADGPDLDGDGACNGGDPDDDADGIPDVTDNCPVDFNPLQEDADGDGLGDVCDLETVASGQCDDDVDNDGDGLTDEADPGCGSCSNGLDDDGDGFADEADSNCGSCGNGLDDDGDGLADEADPNCGSCSNGTDDDGDGFIDEADPDCGSCTNGLDDDGDMATDEADSDCGGGCGDGADNDGDGFTDEADPDCGSCSNGTDDDADGFTDEADSDCGSCSNDLDDDGDMNTDEADSDCGSCTNGTDDDGDGDADEADSNCGGGCGDGADNDGDGFTDEADPDCGSCTNGTDDDGDGVGDEAEPDCAGHSCTNGTDDDGDGLGDEADSDCGSCLNGTDDDGDGDTDCLAGFEDADCGCPESLPAANCSDGIDNDGDGRTDCDLPLQETDCACGPEGPPGNPNCSDGIDNDGDGSTDGTDTQCIVEDVANNNCSDSIDNDADGRTDCDFPLQEINCACGPEGPPGNPTCSDGIDNDGDGSTDAADPECNLEGFGQGNCGDTFDNDGDGATDCADSDCAADPVCAPACGNGVVESGEQCDDGNLISGDGCSSACVDDWVCGNGIIEPGESCDDGNVIPGDGCDSSCLIESPPCGNGLIDPGETCDDGNVAPGDGCDGLCQTEPFACGNGVVDPGEACDDGNLNDGDGCESDCTPT